MGLEGGVLPQEDGGVRQAEAVDALLHVANGEEVLAVPGDSPEDGVLDLIGVLVLVHQNLGVTGGNLLAQVRGSAIRLDQEGQGQVLLVREVGGVQPELFRPEGRGKARRQIQQGQHGGGHGGKVLQSLLPGDVQPGAEGLQGVFRPLPNLLQGQDQGVLLPALGGGQLGEGHGGGQLPGGPPVRGPAQGIEAPGGREEFRAVPGGKGRVPLRPLRTPAELLRPVGGPAADRVQKNPGIGGLVKGGGGGLPGGTALEEPALRGGVALKLVIKLQHQLCQGGIVPARPQGVRQLPGAGGQVLVKAGEHPVQDAAADQDGLAVIQDAEVRGQGMAVLLPGQKVGILPEEGRAKGVHRLNIRLVDPEELAAEVGIGRVLPHAAGELGGNLAPELRGGGPGVGDDQEVVDVMPLLRHIAEEALHQDPGLAGPGGGGNQQAPAPVLHGGSLLGGEGHVTPPPFLRFPARTPPALPGGCTGSGPRPFPPGSGRRGPSRNSGRGCPPPCGSRGPRQ